jgi:DNA-binding transcriptional ArsR family regulator
MDNIEGDWAVGEQRMSNTAEEDVALGVADARFFRALGDPTRLAIIRLLLVQPRNVSELIGELGAPQSRVSNHLACLRGCGFVTTERKGRQITYSISDPRLRRLLALASEMIGDNNKDSAITPPPSGVDW